MVICSFWTKTSQDKKMSPSLSSSEIFKFIKYWPRSLSCARVIMSRGPQKTNLLANSGFFKTTFVFRILFLLLNLANKVVESINRTINASTRITFISMCKMSRSFFTFLLENRCTNRSSSEWVLVSCSSSNRTCGRTFHYINVNVYIQTRPILQAVWCCSPGFDGFPAWTQSLTADCCFVNATISSRLQDTGGQVCRCDADRTAGVQINTDGNFANFYYACLILHFYWVAPPF